MKRLQINNIEELTGIKAATLRIWEKRYGICIPRRGDGNDRQYTVAELEILLDIALLKRNGWKISTLANLSGPLLKEAVSGLTHMDDIYHQVVNKLVLSILATDVEEFEKHVNNSFAGYGVERGLQKIILTFLEKMNMLSYSGTTNEFHIAVTLIRKKLIYYIESLVPEKKVYTSALLFLPRNEHFDLLLLYMCYLLKKQGFSIIYLGNNIPEENIISMLQYKKPDHIYTYVAPNKSNHIAGLVSAIRQASPHPQIHIVGKNGEPLRVQENNENLFCIPYQGLPEKLLSA